MHSPDLEIIKLKYDVPTRFQGGVVQVQAWLDSVKPKNLHERIM